MDEISSAIATGQRSKDGNYGAEGRKKENGIVHERRIRRERSRRDRTGDE